MALDQDIASGSRRSGKSASAFRTISEVADDLDVPPHVLRFWETKFSQVKPLKRGGGRRYYRPEDIALLKRIRELLYSEGYTIKGVQRLLRDGSVKAQLNGDAAAEAPGPVNGNGAAKASAEEGEAATSVASDGGSKTELKSILDDLVELKTILTDARN